MVFDAPPSIGHNIRRAVDEIAAANGVPKTVTHFVDRHHHADHGGAAAIFEGDVVRVGHEETRRLLQRDDDPARPLPEVTFADQYTLEAGGERVELAWRGPNHTPDNIYIHFPEHDTLMFIDVVNAGWVPIYNVNLSEDVIGYMGAPAIALDYPWTHFICGHLGLLATHDDVAVHQQYIADIEASSREALASIGRIAVLRGGRGELLGRGHCSVQSPAAAGATDSGPAVQPGPVRRGPDRGRVRGAAERRRGPGLGPRRPGQCRPPDPRTRAPVSVD